MSPIALKLESLRTHGTAARRGHAIREAIAFLFDRPALDHIRAPEGLEHPVAERSKRLMRNARACGR